MKKRRCVKRAKRTVNGQKKCLKWAKAKVTKRAFYAAMRAKYPSAFGRRHKNC